MPPLWSCRIFQWNTPAVQISVDSHVTQGAPSMATTSCLSTQHMQHHHNGATCFWRKVGVSARGQETWRMERAPTWPLTVTPTAKLAVLSIWWRLTPLLNANRCHFFLGSHAHVPVAVMYLVDGVISWEWTHRNSVSDTLKRQNCQLSIESATMHPR